MTLTPREMQDVVRSCQELAREVRGNLCGMWYGVDRGEEALDKLGEQVELVASRVSALAEVFALVMAAPTIIRGHVDVDVDTAPGQRIVYSESHRVVPPESDTPL